MAQKKPKMAQKKPKMAQKKPKILQRIFESPLKKLFFTFCDAKYFFHKKIAKNASKKPKMAQKSQKWPQKAQSGTKKPYLRSNEYTKLFVCGKNYFFTSKIFLKNGL